MHPHLVFLRRHRPHVQLLATRVGITCTKDYDSTYWRVRTVGDYDIFLVQMLFNWRIVVSYVDTPLLLEGGWCYSGLDYGTFSRALEAAHRFDPRHHDAPQGFHKEAQALRRR